MAERLIEHPLIIYFAFIMPIALLIIGAVAHTSVLFLIMAAAWLGVSFILLFLPIASDNGSSGS
jgi:hypothetical protein